MKRYLKQLLAITLMFALMLGNLPMNMVSVKAAIGNSFVIDLCRPTAGAKNLADGTLGGVTNVFSSGKSETYQVTTALAGDGWKINASRTTTPTAPGDESLYVKADTSSNWISGMHIFKWAANATYNGARSTFYMNGGNALGLDFTAPETGVYKVEAVYVNTSSTRAANLNINGTLFENAVPKGSGSTAEIRTEIGSVELVAGEYANTMDVIATFVGRYATTPRAIIFTKIADVTEPVPTNAPTMAPTLEPTAEPTPSPTEEPNVVKEPFTVSASTVDMNSIYCPDGQRYYFTNDTFGSNWRLSDSTHSSHLVAGTNVSGVARLFPNTTSIATYKTGAYFALDFTAPASGYYDLATNVCWGEKFGYADVYLNGEYVGTLDGNANSGTNEQKLLGVYLNAGPFNNTVSLVSTGRSTGSGSYFSFSDFVFTTPEEVATLTGIDASVAHAEMYIGDTQKIVTKGVLTNGGLYRLTSVGTTISYVSDNESVVKVEDGIITALKPGTATITATSTWNGGSTDTIKITVKEITYTTPEINIEEGWIFTEGDTLSLLPKAKLSNGKYATENLVTVTYNSSNEFVAKVESGVLYALAPGEAQITAHITYNGITLDAVRNITVEADVPEQAFEIEFKSTGNIQIDTDGTRFYFTKDSYGTNWVLSSKTNAPLATDINNLGHCRLFYSDAYAYASLMKTQANFVLEIDVPIAGEYDITANMVKHTNGGYANIYVNDIYVGTVDTYNETTDTTTIRKQPLLGVHLHAGKNTLTIRPTRKSGGTNSYTMCTGFSFTTPEEIASITGIDASADVSEMYVGREEQISIETILSNGGLYQIDQSNETITYETSDAKVAKVSDKGVITAIGAGNVMITVTAVNYALTDTITFDVTDADYDKVEMNLTEGENFYVMNEKALEVVATLTDGTPIAQKDLTITYTSDDQEVAKVENGILKIVGKGNAAVTAQVKFNVTGETKSVTRNIVCETIPLEGITATPEKSVVQELDKDGVPLIVQGIAHDGSIIKDLVMAGFTQFDFHYESLTPEIMTIDANGICRYVSRGVAKIRVKATIDGVCFEEVVDVVSSSAKKGRTLYTDEMVANARYNATHTKWGVKEVSRVSGQSYRFVYDFEHIYDLIFAEGIPRSYENSTLEAQNNIKWFCPACGTNIEELYGGEWETNILECPWKIWCPHCKAKFPSNDFALLYERGLDENGKYNRELAYANNAAAVARGEKDALINELYPDKDPLWMVDDGFGWSPTYGTYGTQDLVQYTPVAKYAHDFWFDGSFSYLGYILYKIRDIYLWTGDERFGIAGAILLDRVADVYPDYDCTKIGIMYHSSHGGRKSGKVVGCIQEHYLASYYLECYDAFYPMFAHPDVIDFLSKKAADLHLDNPKTNGNLIRENIENGIVRTTIKALYEGDILGNFGMQQMVATKAAVVLDTQPETDEVLEWLISPSVVTKETLTDPVFNVKFSSVCSNTGGEMITKYVNEIDRDGFGAEVSTTYNSIWMESGAEIADILARYGSDKLNLYDNPKYVKMYDSFIHMDAGDGYTLQLGDGGEASGAARTNFANETLMAYRTLKDPKLAQIYHTYVNGKYDAMMIDFYTNQKDLIIAVQNDIKEHGELVLESENLTGYGLAMLRGGKAATKENQYETRYDTWMYYGRANTSHAHLDVLNIGIDAFGFNFMPELGYPEATGNSSNRHEWQRHTLSHNTVTVDNLSQSQVYTGYPLHFDSTENVKLIDTESAASYEASDIYRRTVVTIAANEDVSYTLDFFRVKGGNKHTYSFHSQSYKHFFTDDIALVPQVNEKGEYVGTYAGIDVPYGPDPNSTDTQYSSDPMYPRGYTWLTDVNRGTDKSNDGIFTVKFEQSNWKNQVVDASGLAMKVHAINDWTPDSVDFAIGYPPRQPKNEMIPGYDYMFIQRTGENLDTLFTTLLEPFKINDYVQKAEGISAVVKEGTEGEDDISKVVKVSLKNGRTDYVIYATNNNVTYTVTDDNVSFDFKGFVGVYSVDFFGNNVYSYVNDGTIIGNETSVGAYTGTVVDFTKELVMDDYIIINPDQEVKDLSVLENQYIYVDNEGAKCNGAYRILNAEKQGEYIALYLGNCSLIERFVDDYDFDAGFVYTIADGQRFRIPISTTNGNAFTGSNRPSGGVASTTDACDEIEIVDETIENEDIFVPNESTGLVEEIPSTTEAIIQEETNEGTPTPRPADEDSGVANTHSNKMLLAGIGLLALVAGGLLLLIGKKGDEEDEI